MQISFHGAAGAVTGSCHLLQAAGRRILVDCGMYQGSRSLRDENAEEFGFDPAAVDLVLLTHAHLDHCGRIPLLVKRGFRGRVLTTAATRDLAELVLLDSAGLQQEELRHHPNGAATPLYDRNDVQLAMARCDGRMAYAASADLFPGIRATFHDAGHILGSAWILLELEESGQRRRVIFSGDLGNHDKPILNPPEGALAADDIVMESTYGNRNHCCQADSIKEFQQVVAQTLARGGNIVIPTFALERAQDLLFYLRDMVKQKLIAPATPVYLDSPMAISATEIFRRHREDYNPVAAAMIAAGDDPFALPNLHYTRTTQDSMAINQVHGAVIMAGSGMAAGGRVLHHLRHNLDDARNSVVFVGYAALGTPARAIIDGAKTVKMFGEPVAVRAQIATIGGFSAHADHDDLLRWVQAGGKPGRVFLVHGEDVAATVLARDLGALGIPVVHPALHQTVDLNAAQPAAV
ncbi:MAG TPA: MBL fold metallo-hydrolase [Terriglobales bacterium]|nr:MBL fold metallo-hydrolase [Terriglobales bacterium]